MDPLLHSLWSQTGLCYLQSGSTTLQVVLHGEAPRAPSPLAAGWLPGERVRFGTPGGRESQKAGLEPATRRFGPDAEGSA